MAVQKKQRLRKADSEPAAEGKVKGKPRVKIERLPIAELKPNKKNPRKISPEQLAKLKRSLEDFPQMLELRPIVVDKKGVVLGGNMRLAAAKEAGMTTVPVIRADSLTEDQVRQFIVKDNVPFGEWDWTVLSTEWDTAALERWGLDLPGFTVNPDEMSDSFTLPSDEKEPVQQMTFTVTDEQAEEIRAALKIKKAEPGFKAGSQESANLNGAALARIVREWTELRT